MRADSKYNGPINLDSMLSYCLCTNTNSGYCNSSAPTLSLALLAMRLCRKKQKKTYSKQKTNQIAMRYKYRVLNITYSFTVLTIVSNIPQILQKQHIINVNISLNIISPFK